ncbi:CHAT domain-containing protein [Rhizocola hellebori]|uniref:CHAT domain-containing protein n=1 Tax=Rhizocola hellebori TaxID=1392758 RepID=UPI0019448009|nr:CHAT domain-containing protein [Rhizocola hellebori]
MVRSRGLTKDSAFALVEATVSIGDDAAIRSAVLTIASIGTSPAAWREISPLLNKFLERPMAHPSRGDWLEVMAATPLASALQRLSAIATTATDPHAELAGWLLARRGVGPVAAEQIRSLLSVLANQDREAQASAVRTLAMMPIELHEVSPDAFASALNSDDPDTSLFAAIAMARLGDTAQLERMLREMNREIDPAKLEVVFPVPAKLRLWLLKLNPPIHDGSAQVVIEALTGPRMPTVADGLGEALPPSRRADATEVLAAKRTADRLLAANRSKDWRGVEKLDLAALGSLPPDTTEQLIVNLIGLGDAKETRLLDVLDNADTSQLQVARIILDFATGAGPTADHADQLAIVLGACDPHEVMRALGAQLSAADSQARDRLRQLLHYTLSQPAFSQPPELGPPTEVVDDRRTRYDSSSEQLEDVTEVENWSDGFSRSSRRHRRLRAAAPADEAAERPKRPPPPGATAPGDDIPEPTAPAQLPSEVLSPLPPPPVPPPPSPVPPPLSPADRSGQRKVYPRITCPPAVVVETPFECVVGLAERDDPTLVIAGPIAVAGEMATFDVLVTVDPESLSVAEGHQHTLVMNADNPFPAVTLHVTAKSGRQLAKERRIGVHYFCNGKLIGVAWRRLIAVATEAELDDDRQLDTKEQRLLDLSPLLTDEPPDLVLAIYRADDAAHNQYVWAAYPCAAEVAVPDVRRAKDLGESARGFASAAMTWIEFSSVPAIADFLQMQGLGVDVAQAIPIGIQSVLRLVACQPDRASAAAVLLLTEEPHVPWEIAVLQPPLETKFGLTSPFLGAHVAISRWPLVEDSPLSPLQTSLEVRHHAVVTAEYGKGATGNWAELVHARREAKSFVDDYPPADAVGPRFSEVVKCLEGMPRADLLHFALHGRFDAQNAQGGLVVLKDEANPASNDNTQFLTEPMIKGLQLCHKPFVFLNACQVGAGNQILGDYAGMAASILHAGARAVVAPLWNIDDNVAAEISLQFYAAAYGGEPVPVAEILRRIRAGYTRDAADTGGASPTLIAYQLFGHPRLKLHRIASVP